MPSNILACSTNQQFITQPSNLYSMPPNVETNKIIPPKKLTKSSTSLSSSTDPSKWIIHETAQDTSLIPTLGVTLWLGWMGFLVNMLLFLVFINRNVWITTAYVLICAISIATPTDFFGSFGFRLGDWIMLQAEKYFGTFINTDNKLKTQLF